MDQQALDMQMQTAGIGLVGAVIYLAILALVIASVWKLFSKAGQPGWAAIVPIYNYIVWLQMIGKPIWWLLLLFIPFANLVVGIIMMIETAKVFGKGAGFAAGLILLPVVFLPILAFGSSRYQAPAPIAGGIAPAL
jgi:hypothetical protein